MAQMKAGQVLEQRTTADGKKQERVVLDYCLCHQQRPPICWLDKWITVLEFTIKGGATDA